MADERKQSWWKSIPGALTAATGFVAALSGLVAGLSQLGVFRRDQPAGQVVATAPAPRDSMPREPTAPVTGGASSTGTPATGKSPRPASPSMPTPPRSPGPTSRAGSAADTAAEALRLPKGAPLELAVSARTCAPAVGLERLTARLVTPVEAKGTTLLPAGTTAILHLRRAGASSAPQVRLDSMVGRDVALSMPPSDVRVRRGGASGACLRAGARITATLGASVPIRRR